MLTIPASVRIFIGSTPIDMRKSIDSLMAIVQGELREDAYSGGGYGLAAGRGNGPVT